MKLIKGSQFQNKTRWNHLRIPETYLGFPIGDGGERSSSEKSRNLKGRGHNQGIALLIAIMTVAIVMGFMSDMIISSSVNVELALGNRDSVKSEYMAKSGLNLGIFLNSIDWGMDLYMNQNKKKPTDSASDMWAMMNGLPIGGATVEMMMGVQEKFDLSAVSDGKVMDQMKLFDGRFILEATDESRKININYCHQGRCKNVIDMLTALMSCPAEKYFLESKDLSPVELAARVKDFVDADLGAEEASGLSDENDPYLDADPSYQAKNAPFDSLDELKLVEGWDDEVFEVFSPYLTIFPFQKSGGEKATLNLNTVGREMLSCLLPEGLEEECRERFILKMANQGKEKTVLSQGGNIGDDLKDLVCYSVEDSESSSSGDKSKWFVSSSRVFRIEVSGEVGNQSKKIVAVIERLDSKAMKKRKTTKSYELLYWRFI